ncbi:hypothetical protein BaRGS_00021432 [Batillaria attramentaria]|uniref:Uncharacterized protein n=1 Tax=Batillaria attramentaria TaxID=370345 RepID=A0ABD0KJE4_9CAEN
MTSLGDKCETLYTFVARMARVIFVTYIVVVTTFARDPVAENTTDAWSWHSDSESLPKYFLIRNQLLSNPVVQGKVPPGGGTDLVQLNVTLSATDVLDVDDVRQVVSASVILRLGWNDPALSWNRHFPNGSLDTTVPLAVHVPIKEIWTPDLVIMNAATSEQRMLDKYVGDSALIYSDGDVGVFSTPVLDFSCQMNLRKYPFDTQECRVNLFLYSAALLHTSDRDPDFDLRVHFSVSAEWTLESERVEKKMLAPAFPYLEYVWTLKRKTTYFVISFIVPIVLTSYMNTLVFIIPADSGEKISYLVSIFVSNAVFVSFCTDIMPQGLDETPLIMYLVLGIMAQSAILIVINSLIVRRFHGNGQPNTDQPVARTKVSAAANLNDTTSQYALARNSLEQDSNQDMKNSADTQANREIGEQFNRAAGFLKLSNTNVARKSGPFDFLKSGASAKSVDNVLFLVALVVNTVFVWSVLLYII